MSAVRVGECTCGLWPYGVDSTCPSCPVHGTPTAVLFVSAWLDATAANELARGWFVNYLTSERTVKCPICEKPYVIYTGRVGDQSACKKCRDEARDEAS